VSDSISLKKVATQDSILLRLYYLYRFLCDRDLVVDEMHIVHLNLVKTALKNSKENKENEVDWATADKQLKFPLESGIQMFTDPKRY